MLEAVERWAWGTSLVVLEDEQLLLQLNDDVAVTMRVESPEDGVAILTATWSAPPTLTEPNPPVTIDALADAAAMARSGLLRCHAEPPGAVIRMTVYLEGLNRQGFLYAAGEVGRAYEFLESASRELHRNVELLEDARRQTSEATDALTATRDTAGTWAATHVVVLGGADAWAEPDGRTPVVVHLPVGMELALRVQRGGWAQVESDSGWSGWVDARNLTPKR